MKNLENVMKHLTDRVLPSVKKTDDTLTVMMKVNQYLSNVMTRMDKLEEVFVDVGMEKAWTNCPDCGMHVIVEMGNCPVCATDLIAPSEEVIAEVEEIEEEVEEPKKKAAKKAPQKKKAAKKKPEPEIVDEVEEEEMVEEDGPYTESGEVESEDDSLPTTEEIMEMKKADLVALIEELELEVDEALYTGRVSIKKLRIAVDEAIEAYLAEDGEEGEEEYEEVDEEADVLEEVEDEVEEVDDEDEEPTEDELDDIDLDNVDLEDLEDFDELEEDEDE